MTVAISNVPNSQRRFRSLFISDIHLGAKGCRADRLLDFLSCHDAEVIYLVGDIFDNQQRIQCNWSADHDAIVQNLITKVKKGQRIVYIPGNHDQLPRRQYGKYFGCIDVIDRFLHTAADGKRFLVIHGDCFDMIVQHAKWLASIGRLVDRVVRALNELLNKARRSRGLLDWCFMDAIIPRVNRLITQGDLFESRVASLVHEHAADGVICGHFHSAEIHQKFGIVYANCGDWIDSCTAIAENADGELQVISSKTQYAPPKIHGIFSKKRGSSGAGDLR
jgi:UDP-2,3-diacylglucosamine pyrophosphatase LpxH